MEDSKIETKIKTGALALAILLICLLFLDSLWDVFFSLKSLGLIVVSDLSENIFNLTGKTVKTI